MSRSRIGFNFRRGKDYRVVMSNSGWYYICLVSEYRKATHDGLISANFKELLRWGNLLSGWVDKMSIEELRRLAKSKLDKYLCLKKKESLNG